MHVSLIFTRHIRDVATMSGAPGGLSSSLLAGSDDTMYCKLCPTVKATAYCMQCKIYMCPSCVDHHMMIPVSASHMLVTGDKFLSVYPTGHGQYIKQCPDHPDEEIKFYCNTHDALCCCACNLDHNQCTIKYIRNISKDFHRSQDYAKLKEDIRSSEDKIKHCFKNIDDCLKAVQNMNRDAIAQFTRYKAVVIAYLDKREKELLMDLKYFREQDTAALEELRATAKTLQADLSEAQTKLRLHEDSSHELFIATKRTQALLTTLESSLNEIKSKTGNRSVKLLKDPAVKKLLVDKRGLAHVVTELRPGMV